LGSTEQHGPHLPLGTDTELACSIARSLARQRPDVVVAPALPYGSSGEHAAFPGTLSIGQAALELVLVELVRSADAFAGVVLVNGHGGNVTAVARASEQLRAEGRQVLAWSPRVDGGDAHAGVVEVSPNGVLGDPTGASAEQGRALFAQLTADLVITVAEWWD
jgi:creatinine amidohydrolase